MMPKQDLTEDRLLSKEVAGVVKLEEMLSGVTLNSLLFSPMYKDFARSLTMNDWQSLVWQNLMTHFVLQVNAGILHRDAHASNSMVSIMHSPAKIGYEWAGKSIVTPESRLLVQRMDWSDSIPYKSLDAFDQRACLASFQYTLGTHTRNLSLRLKNNRMLEDERWRRFLPMFTAPLYADLMDSISIFVSFVATTAKHILEPSVFEQLKQFVMAVATTLVRANGRMLHEDFEISRTMIQKMMIVQGGFCVPDSWFNVDDALLKNLFDSWIGALSETMGRDPEIVQVIDPVMYETVTVTNADQLYTLDAFPVLVAQDNIRASMVKWSDALWRQASYVFRASGIDDVVGAFEFSSSDRQLDAWHTDVARKLGLAQHPQGKEIATMMLTLAKETRVKPQVYASLCASVRTQIDLYKAQQHEFVTGIVLSQLANAAAYRIGVSHLYEDYGWEDFRVFARQYEH
jgi:hypothetical protein